MTKERIEVMREAVLPFCKEKLVEINYEGLGESDAEEFENDFNELLNLAIKGIEQESCEDAMNRQAVLDMMQMRMGGKELYKAVYDLPPVTPVACIAKVTFDKDDLQKFVDEAVKDIVVERKKGKWVEECDDYGEITGWHCSNCYDETGFVTDCAWGYCPTCGAEMEIEYAIN